MSDGVYIYKISVPNGFEWFEQLEDSFAVVTVFSGFLMLVHQSLLAISSCFAYLGGYWLKFATMRLNVSNSC